MRNRTRPEEDSVAGVRGHVSWIVTDIQVLPGHRLHVRFIDGIEGEVDASRLLFAKYAGVFAPLRDPALFAQAYVADGVVTWPGELDLAPDAMYDEIKAHGRWQIEPFPQS